MRAGRQVLVRGVGRGSREQVEDLEAVIMSVMREESAGEKAVREGGGGRSGGGKMIVGGGGAEGLAMEAVREEWILEILLLKAWRNELQSSGEESVLLSGGWRSFLTVEKRVRGFLLVLLMRVE